MRYYGPICAVSTNIFTMNYQEVLENIITAKPKAQLCKNEM